MDVCEPGCSGRKKSTRLRLYRALTEPQLRASKDDGHRAIVESKLHGTFWAQEVDFNEGPILANLADEGTTGREIMRAPRRWLVRQRYLTLGSRVDHSRRTAANSRGRCNTIE